MALNMGSSLRSDPAKGLGKVWGRPVEPNLLIFDSWIPIKGSQQSRLYLTKSRGDVLGKHHLSIVVQSNRRVEGLRGVQDYLKTGWA